MRAMRQKIQLTLPFAWDSPGESGGARGEGTEVRTAQPESELPARSGLVALAPKSVCSSPLNRRVRTRTHGGVGGVGAVRPPPIPIGYRDRVDEAEGLSPRARGILLRLEGTAVEGRSIPACAGNTRRA